jgi:putative ABC transport system permease protein
MSVTELRLSIRALRKQPVVTFTTVLALAVGIGMATAGFTLLDSVLYSKLPFPNGDRFVLLDVYTEPDAQRTRLEADRFRFFAGQASAFEHLGAFRGTEVNLVLRSEEIVPVKGAVMTPDSVRVFPYAPVLGRTLRAEDGVRNAPSVMLIRESLWRRHFSADPGILGMSATVSGLRRAIVGVMPDTFEFPNSPEVWLPLGDTDSAHGTSWTSVHAFGVLRSGRDLPAAHSQIAALSKQFEAETPVAPRLRVNVVGFTEALSRGLEVLNVMVVGCLVLVLVVIAANIASLVLARTASKARDLAVRTALGATRARLVGQIFTEVLLLGIVAAAIGLTASQAVLAWVRRTLNEMPFWVDFTASIRTMVFVAGATLLAAAVGGVLPALKATRRDTASGLAETSRTSTGFGVVGGTMIAVQVALSIALLNGALVMARGVAGYMAPSLRVPAMEVLTARIWSERTPPPAALDAILDAIASMPGVTSVGAGTSLPGLSPETEMTIVEHAASVPRAAPVVAVRGGFFETLGATAEAGRLFAPSDFATDAPPVAIVNEPFVRKFFEGRNPIGQRVRTIPSGAAAAPQPWHEIVGVVPDLGLSAGDETMAAGFYVPMRSGQLFNLALRTSGDARRLAASLVKAIGTVDPSIQIRDVIPLQDVGREDRMVFAGIGAALGGLGGMALLLSVVGTYAILSLSVTRRTREIGIRTALGASRAQVLRSIMAKTCVPPALGALAGIALGQLLVQARGIFAFRLPDGSGPWGLAFIGVAMVAAGLLSAWVPTRRALAVAPSEALRAE